MKRTYISVILIVLSVLYVVSASAKAAETAVPFSLNDVKTPVMDDFQNTGGIYGDANWDVNETYGSSLKGWGRFYFSDNSATEVTQRKRVFQRLTDDEVLFSFKMKMDTYFDGVCFELRDGKTCVLKFTTELNALYFYDKYNKALKVGNITTDKYHLLKVILNQKTGKAQIYWNETNPITDGEANVTGGADNVYISTSKEAVGKCYLSQLRVMAGYFVSEYAWEGDGDKSTKLPKTMSFIQNGGTITTPVVIARNYQSDKNSFLLTSKASTAKVSAKSAFSQKADWITYDYNFCQKERKYDGFVVNIGDGITLQTKDGKLCHKNSDGTFEDIYEYVSDVVYNIRVNANNINHKYDVYINGMLKKCNIPMTANNYGYIEFTAVPNSVQETIFDKIEVFARKPEPTNYVEKPVKANSSQLLGVLSCSLWEMGQQSNWPCITAFEERMPWLGYYDGNSVEVADWENKWMSEHGIDYRIYCWFSNSANAPIDQGGLNDLDQGHKYSKYKDDIKYALMIENYNSTLSGLSNFKKYTLPCLIEKYFKDDNYQKIDNKPIVSIFSVAKFAEQMGGSDKVNEAIQAIRDACVAAGFNGAYVMTVNGGREYDFDACHMYNYGYEWTAVNKQKQAMTTFFTQTYKNFIPTAVMGWDPEPWGQPKGSILTPAEFNEVLRYIKEDLQPGADKTKDGKNMVIFGNWNEFGEGHILMPMGSTGFAYLDAIRDIFVDEDTHFDATPTDSQKARITTMYDNSRIVRRNLPVKVVDKNGNQTNVLDNAVNVIFDAQQSENAKGYVAYYKDGRLSEVRQYKLNNTMTDAINHDNDADTVKIFIWNELVSVIGKLVLEYL